MKTTGISTSKKRKKGSLKRKPWREYEHQKLVYLCEVEGLTQKEAGKQLFGRTHHAVLKRCGDLKAEGEWDRIKAENERTGFKPRTERGRSRKIKNDQLELDFQMPRPWRRVKPESLKLTDCGDLTIPNIKPETTDVESSRYWLYVKVISAFSAGAILGMAIGHNFL